ncbi:hypothetical protein RCG23_22190 [Neobacillus sp. PS3-34]|uniref:hypothetical protein n=1 Tax=Neobacillus sp. PS3-34 TaxID=3070678 RepID=UPI0027E05205|nr:hypothetical protein [Neobacillus sp. PS3-34]WML47978.1 hypothetical protein RCG23_22190 [Neobacillus sp. PS3-34]
MLSNRLRRLNRYREIVSILGKYGYGFLIEDVGLSDLLTIKDRFAASFKQGDSEETGTRIRELLEELRRPL